MDFLFFCVGECEDALRDRDFYLVQRADSEEDARVRLAAHFRAIDCGWDEESFAVFLTGSNLQEGRSRLHYDYKLEVI